MAYSVFISYSTADLDTVARMRTLLEQSGITVFVAEFSVAAGEPLGPRIEEAIAACDLFILVWSSRSRASEWVGQEIGLAKAQGKAILPLVVEERLELPGFIKGLKYLSAHKNPERALAWVQGNVFAKAKAKDKQAGMVWLGVGAALLWALNQKD